MQNANNEWKAAVKRLSVRRSLVNYGLGTRIVQSLGYPEFYTPKTTILDMYSGTAVFSAALHNEIHPSKHILLEPFPSYREWMGKLAQSPNICHDRSDPFRWSTFQNLKHTCGFEPETQPRNQVHNSLLFTANLLHAQGEQLATQYINCMANQSWIQRFGRVRLLLWLRSSTAEKMVAAPNEKYRHRISCQTESCCDTRIVVHTPPSPLPENYPKKLLNPLVTDGLNIKQDFTGRATHGVSLVEFTPLEHQIEHIDEFDYVILKLFILKSKPLSQALNNLGPGAIEDLGPHLPDLLDTPPSKLTIDDLKRITAEFVRWPFKPDTLADYYDDGGSGNSDIST